MLLFLLTTRAAPRVLPVVRPPNVASTLARLLHLQTLNPLPPYTRRPSLRALVRPTTMSFALVQTRSTFVTMVDSHLPLIRRAPTDKFAAKALSVVTILAAQPRRMLLLLTLALRALACLTTTLFALVQTLSSTV